MNGSRKKGFNIFVEEVLSAEHSCVKRFFHVPDRQSAYLGDLGDDHVRHLDILLIRNGDFRKAGEEVASSGGKVRIPLDVFRREGACKLFGYGLVPEFKSAVDFGL